MTHDYKKYKYLRKLANFFGFRLVDKNFIKNMNNIENFSINSQKVLDRIVKLNQFKKIIQVGSNDGLTDDYVMEIIKKYDLTSILIEPEPEAFKKLKENYHNSKKIVFINKALDKRDSSSKKFYIVKKEYLKFYHENISVLSSFNNNHLIKWGVKQSHISSIDIECISWITLLDSNNFHDVQVICIDAEGYDHELVHSLFYDTKLRPVIIFEWVNIPNSKIEDLLNLLKKNNYEILKLQKDLVCYKSNIII